MKILVIGAGAVGGYFGGRLLAAGRDVTFLVREKRARQLDATGGLVITGPTGDLHIPNPPLVTADSIAHTYDVVLLSCKAPALDACIRDMTPAIGPETRIIPVLNGMRHIDILVNHFSAEQVMGGSAFIFSTLDADGRVIHQSLPHGLDYGDLQGGVSDRAAAIHAELSNAGFDASLNPDIMSGMWNKWLLINCLAGSTCLMRAPIGDIVAAGALPFSLALVEEVKAVAAAYGHTPPDAFVQRIVKTLSTPGSMQSASMHKDMDKGLPTEADHLIGDMVRRAETAGVSTPILTIINYHMRTYEARRARETAAQEKP